VGTTASRSEVASHAEVRLPKVGVVSAWFHPEDPIVWSGVPKGVIDELRRLGVYAGFRNVTPWPRASRVLHRWLTRTGRSQGWILSREMRALAQLSDKVNRMATPPDVDGWVHFVGGYGEVVRGRFVTLFEMSPSQLHDAALRWGSALGYPGATPRQLAWVARRQAGVYRRAHACCVASRWAADSLIRDHGIGAAKIHVVGYGRNADLPPPAHRDWTTPRFLFIGRDWQRKNGDAVVRAFARVRCEVPEAQLDVVGGHPRLTEDGVTGHGLIEVSDPGGRVEIEALFARATCFVLPSLFEPFGIVYAEAGASGLPSIAGSIGGTADSVGDGGVLVDPYDEDSIYRAMRHLCDRDTAQHLGLAALRRSRGMTWAATGQRVLRALDLAPIPGAELAEFL
jgi:glycosyltransferase involved in cell wall biosynthesis